MNVVRQDHRSDQLVPLATTGNDMVEQDPNLTFC